MSELTLEDALRQNEAARAVLRKGWKIVLGLAAVLLVFGGLYAHASRHSAHGLGALIFFAFPPLVVLEAIIGLNIAGALARRRHVTLDERPHATPEQIDQAARLDKNIRTTRIVANLWVVPLVLLGVAEVVMSLLS